MPANFQCDCCDFQKRDCSNDKTVKLLPTGGDGNMIVCFIHWNREMAYREQRNKELGRMAFELPKWKDLKVYSGG